MRIITCLTFGALALYSCSSKEEAPPQRQEGNYYPREDMPWFEYPPQSKPQGKLKSESSSQAEDEELQEAL